MLKVKYKMHRFVNILFYGVVFIGGFLVGYGFKGGDIIEKLKEIFVFI